MPGSDGKALFDDLVKCAVSQGWRVTNLGQGTPWEFVKPSRPADNLVFEGDIDSVRAVTTGLRWPLERAGLIYPLPLDPGGKGGTWRRRLSIRLPARDQ